MRTPSTLLMAALLLAPALRADSWPPGDFGFSRYAGYLANPPLREQTVRDTRTFVKVLRPMQRQTLSYDASKQYRGIREWSYDRQRRRPVVLGAWSSRRGIRYRWDMLGVPPGARVERAVLRVYPGKSWYRSAARHQPKVLLSMSAWGPEVAYWTTEDTPDPPGVPPVVNGPVFEWDVTEQVRDAHTQEGDVHRPFQLIVRDLNYPPRPLLRLGVVYRIGVRAPAERRARLSD